MLYLTWGVHVIPACHTILSHFNHCNRRLPITMYSGNVCTAGPARPGPAERSWERSLERSQDGGCRV